MVHCPSICSCHPPPLDSKDKALAIRLLHFGRPHMRAFWFATWGFFIAFLGWFAMAPLMTTIQKDLGLTKDEVYNSNILAVTATIFARIIIGPLCDRIGARLPMASLLIICAIPLGCSALVTNAAELYVVRSLIGLVGGVFVPCQFWTTAMFSGSIVGSANALAAGWGNMGGGITSLLMVGFMAMFTACGIPDNKAWRYCLIIPACIWVITGVLMIFLSDDSPAGKWKDRIKVEKKKYSLKEGLLFAAKEPFVYILTICYACGFGVELYVDNTAAAWFEHKFQLDHNTAGIIASLFGLMNIFARALGGWCSDYLAKRWFLRGRMLVIVVCIVFSGAFLCVLSAMNSLGAAIGVLIVFSIFCQASCGAVYGLVPFVTTQYGGIVSGFVGAGGSVGAMSWGFVHKAFGANNQEDTAYMVVGIICMVGGCLVFAGRLHGAALLPCLGTNGQEAEETISRAKLDASKLDLEANSDDLGSTVYVTEPLTTGETSTDLGATVYDPCSPTLIKAGSPNEGFEAPVVHELDVDLRPASPLYLSLVGPTNTPTAGREPEVQYY